MQTERKISIKNKFDALYEIKRRERRLLTTMDFRTFRRRRKMMRAFGRVFGYLIGTSQLTAEQFKYYQRGGLIGWEKNIHAVLLDPNGTLADLIYIDKKSSDTVFHCTTLLFNQILILLALGKSTDSSSPPKHKVDSDAVFAGLVYLAHLNLINDDPRELLRF